MADSPETTVENPGLAARYQRIELQLEQLFVKNTEPVSRMATAAALLHHKQPHFFWTGFYRVIDAVLFAAAYQGPLACSPLEPGTGVCWACFEGNQAIVVPDVEQFPGHIPCDSRSRSEVVVPVRNPAGECIAVLDVDSTELSAFSAADAAGLLRIADLIYAGH